MADDTTTSQPSDRDRGPDRGPRGAGPREGGGFRIRLSDNEMQAARALQEAFGLRSTVAVLGFSLRTLAQQLENGELDELVARQRAQGGGRPPAPRGGERRRERGEGGRGEGSGRGEGGARAGRVDPFARPSRPAAPAPASEPTAEVSEQAAEEDPTAGEIITAEAGEASVEAAASEAETLVAEEA